MRRSRSHSNRRVCRSQQRAVADRSLLCRAFDFGEDEGLADGEEEDEDALADVEEDQGEDEDVGN